jgi:hypothetical protein
VGLGALTWRGPSLSLRPHGRRPDLDEQKISYLRPGPTSVATLRETGFVIAGSSSRRTGDVSRRVRLPANRRRFAGVPERVLGRCPARLRLWVDFHQPVASLLLCTNITGNSC